MTTQAPSVTRARAAHLGPERRRPLVLDAALAVAVEQGVSAVTIGSVAERLGVTRPVVYACFADRVELIEALLGREADCLRGGLLAALHGARGDDPQAAFVSGYQALLRVVAERPDSWRLVFAANPDPAVVDRFVCTRSLVARRASRWLRPALIAWWGVQDVDRKLPVVVALFMSSCEAAMRLLLDPSNAWSAQDLGEFFGRAMCRAFSAA